jgi:FAD:protein FMN transferase
MPPAQCLGGLPGRAKPMLGTIVALRLHGVDRETFERATASAFARVATVHAAMSFHDPASDLRALARAVAGSIVCVRLETWNVLQAALEIEARTGGSFNPCCAAELVARGLLPPPHDALPSAAATLAQGVELLPACRVRVLRTPWLDLGGIAKGFAVDAAAAALQSAGVKSGVVNAGGDLCAFGPARTTVVVRSPREGGALLPLARIADMACATSAACPSGRAAPPLAHLVCSTQARDATAPISVSVFASSCTVADALTKHVWQRGPSAAEVLAHYGASAFVMCADASSYRIGAACPRPS